MIHVVALDEGYEVSDDPARLDLDLIDDFLRGSYWAASRPRALTERAIAHSLCLGLYGPGGVQAGFARVLTDRALRAHLADVFVLTEHRGRGRGRALVSCALDHPELRSVGAWTLTTRDAHGLYAPFGFVTLENSGDQMVRRRPDL